MVRDGRNMWIISYLLVDGLIIPPAEFARALIQSNRLLFNMCIMKSCSFQFYFLHLLNMETLAKTKKHNRLLPFLTNWQMPKCSSKINDFDKQKSCLVQNGGFQLHIARLVNSMNITKGCCNGEETSVFFGRKKTCHHTAVAFFAFCVQLGNLLQFFSRHFCVT